MVDNHSINERSPDNDNVPQSKGTGVSPSEGQQFEVIEPNNQTTKTTKPVQAKQAETEKRPLSDIEILATTEERTGGPIFLARHFIGPELFEASIDFVQKNKNLDQLNVIIWSPGGDPDFAFKTALLLKSCCSKMKVYIPYEAKSAATLLCLIANEIVMGTRSELGPLDMQLPDPRNSTQKISALCGYRALEAVANFLHDELDVTVQQLMKRAGTNVLESLTHAMQLITPMTRPLFEQVNPLDLGNFSNALDVNKKYAKELLIRSGVPADQAGNIAKTLVTDYPSHSFVIDFHEAERIGLRVREPNAAETKALAGAYNIIRRKFKNIEYCGPLLEIGAI